MDPVFAVLAVAFIVLAVAYIVTDDDDDFNIHGGSV